VSGTSTVSGEVSGTEGPGPRVEPFLNNHIPFARAGEEKFIPQPAENGRGYKNFFGRAGTVPLFRDGNNIVKFPKIQVKLCAKTIKSIQNMNWTYSLSPDKIIHIIACWIHGIN
jgi:hypothetical protein